MKKYVLLFTWFVVVACTVCIYMLIFPFFGNLFVINLVAAIFAESVLLATIPILSSKSLINFQNATLYILVRAYAIVVLLWTIGFTVAHGLSLPEDQDGFMHHYGILIGLLVITIVFVGVIGIAYFSGTKMKELNVEVESHATQRQLLKLETERFQNAVSGIQLGDDFKWNTAIRKKIQLITMTVQTIPATKVFDAQEQIMQINNELNLVEQAMQRFEAEPIVEQRPVLERAIDLALSKIQYLKKTI